MTWYPGSPYRAVGASLLRSTARTARRSWDTGSRTAGPTPRATPVWNPWSFGDDRLGSRPPRGPARGGASVGTIHRGPTERRNRSRSLGAQDGACPTLLP